MGLRHHAQFLSRTVFVVKNDVEKAGRVLNRILSNEGILEQYRYSMYFERPSLTKRRVNYEKCKAIYTEDMQRRIRMVVALNRVEPIPGSQ